MSKMIFEYQGVLSNNAFYDKNSTKSIVMELSDDNLTISEILNEFQNFLRASGYYFDNGAELSVVNPKDDGLRNDWTTDDWDEIAEIDEEDMNPLSIDSEKPSKYNFSDEEITAEIIRLRDSTPGLSEEGYEMAAWHNLAKKVDGEV